MCLPDVHPPSQNILKSSFSNTTTSHGPVQTCLACRALSIGAFSVFGASSLVARTRNHSSITHSHIYESFSVLPSQQRPARQVLTRTSPFVRWPWQLVGLWPLPLPVSGRPRHPSTLNLNPNCAPAQQARASRRPHLPGHQERGSPDTITDKYLLESKLFCPANALT